GVIMQEGYVKQVMGPVVDVEFPTGDMPNIFKGLKLTNKAIKNEEGNLTLKVAQNLGDRAVRAIAMDTTDGLARGDKVSNTGDSIKTPVGKEVLGRILNVIGDPVDNGPKVQAKEYWSIHREAPTFDQQSTSAEMLMTGIKVVDLLAPYAKGGKIGLFGG